MLDPTTEAYIERILEQSPPLTPEQAALIVRIFAAEEKRR